MNSEETRRAVESAYRKVTATMGLAVGLRQGTIDDVGNADEAYQAALTAHESAIREDVLCEQPCWERVEGSRGFVPCGGQFGRGNPVCPPCSARARRETEASDGISVFEA